jgi:hypothetical protein
MDNCVLTFILPMGIRAGDEGSFSDFALLNLADMSWGDDQMYPAAAFNNVSGRYLVTFIEWLTAGSTGVGVILKGTSKVNSQIHLKVYKTSVAFHSGPTGTENVVDVGLCVDLNGDYKSEIQLNPYPNFV